jgi:hypothetical protein
MTIKSVKYIDEHNIQVKTSIKAAEISTGNS